MKVAVCFSGSIRDFPSCYPSMKRYLLDNLNADIFLHLWKMSDVANLDTNVHFKWKNDACQEQYVIDNLKPVKYVIDNYSQEWEDKILKECRVDTNKFVNDKLKNYGVNACGMYYKINKAFELMEEHSRLSGTKYDLVIRARLDFIWEDNILLENFIDINDQCVYLIKDRYASHSRLLTNDKFFAGSMSAMKKMCNLFNCISDYQSKGLMIEGQTLHENHIKFSALDVKWIGHPHTYYKCMGRHTIKNNKIYILIDNNTQLSKFWFEFSYYLMYNNYNVIYLNSESNNKYIGILQLFPNFKVYNNTFSLGKAICIIGPKYRPELNIKQIIINDTVYSPNTTQIIINENIYINDLVDFIYSIIINKKYGGQYNFTERNFIDKINTGDLSIFKHMDHGYYLGTIVSYDASKDRYKLQVGTEHLVGSRINIKIFDLLKYWDPSNPSLMPVNIHRYNSVF
jgi:hypothetical protein